uniref:SoHo domain-containing protein n=1 Tax=Ascaris lumbricoides TaxID=6252 RepID=A0A9J2PKP4_ASCLU
MRLDEKRNRHFEKLGTEESQTIETFERKIHGTPEIEPQHHYSYNTYTERRTYGRDENGEIVVKIEKDPKDPVRPATPVRPVTPVGDIPQEHYFKAIEPFDTLPLSIPRIDIRKNDGSKASNSPHSFSSYNEQISPRSGVSFEQRSTRSARSAPISPRQVTNTSAIPMKKVTRKSRWVSIHDGRPMSPFVETVTYEPKYPIMDRSYYERTHLNPDSITKKYLLPFT